ncbi:hypothetical protein [Vibrio methylphosphonaticus]|uniref:hypothetical protein n=1 Tax=Vibrio methylphosphonaticus TaxID=2946866 RepID=UPI002029B611|nr:hypothetical protein [Vibrio methylphosphonaticus]MCL9774954.1 hypothetical protein [Vibrio methylphosphonaticus]
MEMTLQKITPSLGVQHWMTNLSCATNLKESLSTLEQTIESLKVTFNADVINMGDKEFEIRSLRIESLENLHRIYKNEVLINSIN